MNKETLPGLLEKYQLLRESFSHIRLKLPASERDERCNSALAEHMPLADGLWYYEELRGVETGYGGRVSLRGESKVDEIIKRRLEAGELIGGKMKTDNFGKLCERLLKFKQLETQRHIAAFWPLLMPLADKMLEELKARRLALVRGSGPRKLAAGSLHEAGGVEALAAVPEAVVESVPTAPALRIAVLGDASASMQTAINSATIIGAMMSAIFEAELVFFNNKAFKSKIPMPGTTSDVLAVTEEVRANCSTSPAAALYEFYKRKQKIDIFLCVTDEQENTGYDGRSCLLGRHGPQLRVVLRWALRQVPGRGSPLGQDVVRLLPPRPNGRGCDGVGPEGAGYRGDANAHGRRAARPVEVRRHCRQRHAAGAAAARDAAGGEAGA